jgi:murein DD-endopeptidase MepM/ murein hydrolase activator NlpD
MKVRSYFLVALAACTGEITDAGVDDREPPTELGDRFSSTARRAQVTGTGGAGLRLRTGAGAGFAVLLVMPEGATVDVIGGPTAGWYNVRYQATTGWAHGDYLEPIAPPQGANNLLPWTANTSHWVTQGHNGGSHTGAGAWAWDFGMPVGTPILAAHFGTVRLVKGNSTAGGCSSAFANSANYVIVDQGNGYESLYLHLSSVSVVAGQTVSRGDLVGHSGQTGWSCGPHLHFQIQLSPSNGGGTGFYNPSIHDYFYDPDVAWDPAPGQLATSKNGVSSQPLQPADTPGAIVDLHGDVAWDSAMRAASSE